MTRLVEDDINTLIVNLKEYDGELTQQTGMALADVAMRAVGSKKPLRRIKTAVIPVTSGLGIIDGFSDTVCGILKYCGIDAFVTDATDVGGIQEAYRKGAEMIFMADDDICSSFSVNGGVYSDNGYATGIGFAAALYQAMEKRKQTKEKVLVMGLGPVGTAAAQYLQSCGCNVWVYDTNEVVVKSFVKKNPRIQLLDDPSKKKEFIYMYDATPVSDVVKEKDVSEHTVVAAPGMPLGVDKAAAKVATVIHNPLELGIVTMYCDCVEKMEQVAKWQNDVCVNGGEAL